MYINRLTMIIPAIIPESESHLKKTLSSISFAEAVQIDVVDGKFVPFTSWPYKKGGDPADLTAELNPFYAEVDLMVNDPIEAGTNWIEAGVKRLIFHLESLGDKDLAINLCRRSNIEVIFSISNQTPLEDLYPYIDKIDGVQLMGIAEIGSQGQPFDPNVLERIVSLRALFPKLAISVDGGVNKETILNLKKAGADKFIAGSAILKADDPEAAYQELLKIITEKEVANV